MANLLYFINDTTNIAAAYDFDGTAQADDNISLGTGVWRGGVASDSRIYFLKGDDAIAYDFDGNRQSDDDIALGSGSWDGAFATDNRIYFIDNTNDDAIAYDFDGNRQSSDDIALGGGSWRGGVASDDRIYVVNLSTFTAVAWDFDGNRQSSDDISLDTAVLNGGAASEDRLYFVNGTTNTAVAYDFDGTAQADDNISLGSGSWQGGATIFESSPTSANNAPSFQDASYSFSDVAIAVNTVVGTVAATDADNDTLSYSLTGTDAGNFSIDSDGEITVTTALTHSTTYNFNVVADDQTDTTSVAVTVVAVAAANNAPSFSESSYSFTDVAIAVNTVVGTVAATDADNDTLSYTLTGTDASDFAISSSGEITVATELAHSDTYNFNVVADDATDTTSVAVTVTTAAAAVSNLPVWQTGSNLESDVDALASASIDIAGKVSDEDEIEVISGVLDWMEWDGSTLDITEAPIFREDRVFRIRFRARNDDGTEDATYRLTVNGSKLVWLHSTLLFKPPIHWNDDNDRVEIRGSSTKVREMSDNRYDTYSEEDDVDVDVSDADGNATKIDAIGLVTKDVDSYSLTPSGGSGSGFTDREIPSAFDTIDGRSQSREINGLQWELYPLPAQVSATSVRLKFTGTDVEVYAVMLLELLLEIRDGEFVDVLPGKVDRAGRVLGNDGGDVDRVSRLGAERWKWETRYLLNTGQGLSQESESEFLRFLSANPDVFHVQESARYPTRMHLAVMTALELSAEAKSIYKGAGSVVPFEVAEV